MYLTVTKPSKWLKSQPIEEALGKKALKSRNNPTLSEQHAGVAEDGQLWGVKDSELGYFAE